MTIPTITDDLIAAIEDDFMDESACLKLVEQVAQLEKDAAQMAANHCHSGYGDDYGHHRCGYQDKIVELEKDAARLDYLLAEHATVDSMRGMKGTPVYRLCWPHLSEQQTEWHQSEREAIDSAMQATQ